MIHLKPFTFLFLAGILSLSACTTQAATPSVSATQPPIPAAVSTPIPTPFSQGDFTTWDALQVSMNELDITNEYLTDFGSVRLPPAGKKFLWVHVNLKNTGQTETGIPASEHYSILYAALEIKPIYGHRSGYVDYTSLSGTVFPNQSVDGWLRFDIPDTAKLSEMSFVFLPKSVQVGASYSSPNYPYSADKPTFVWNCAP